MSNPRYTPRSFAVHPRDFGRNPRIEWLPKETWTVRESAQLDASQLQHRVAYGVMNVYLPPSRAKRVTKLAEALEMPYARLQRLLTGHSVMQLEDLGRLRCLVGDNLDPWLLRDHHTALLKAGHDAIKRESTLAKTRLTRAGLWAASESRPPLR